jgi:hypothetical protein
MVVSATRPHTLPSARPVRLRGTSTIGRCRDRPRGAAWGMALCWVMATVLLPRYARQASRFASVRGEQS